MHAVDLMGNPRVRELNAMLHRISGMSEPQDVQIAFSRTIGQFSPMTGYVSVSVRGLLAGEYKITRMLLDPETRQTARPNPWRDWNSLPTHRGGFIGEAIQTPTPKLYQNVSLVGDPVLGDQLAPFRCLTVVPLFDEGRALNWSVALHESPEGLDEASVEELLIRGNLVGRMTRSLVIRKELARVNDDRRRQLEQIARIQQALLPDRLPRVHGLTIAASYLPSNEAGGDFYDFFDMGDGRLGALIADVSGHGAGAAVVVAMLQTILHEFPDRTLGPAAMLDHANHRLIDKRIDGSFTTAFFGVFDRARRTLTFSNAGHNRPLVHRAGGRVEVVEGAAGLPLGITTEAPYTEASIRVDDADTLVLYTDGIVEARAQDEDRTMFGNEGLRDSLLTCSGAPECVIDSIHQALFSHTGVRDRDDDQTIVAMRVDERRVSPDADSAPSPRAP